MHFSAVPLVAIALLLVRVPCVQAADSTRAERLEAYVKSLSTEIGERNLRTPDSLTKAEQWTRDKLSQTKLNVVRETYECQGKTVANLYVDVRGTTQSDHWIVIGAHYDSAPGTPGANDNATGVAAMLELAKSMANARLEKSVRFVAFVNEEPPYFQTGAMGSLIHADGCKKRGEQIDAMISIETIGCYSDAPNSQHFPAGLQKRFPTTGNFVAIVANPESAQIAGAIHDSFRSTNVIPAELAVLPAEIPGVGWSDHWSFWQHGFAGVMITDTAPFRYDHYHKPSDTPDKIDFVRMTFVVDGLEQAIVHLADGKPATRPSQP